MSKLSLIFLILLLNSCGNPDTDRGDFKAYGSGPRDDNDVDNSRLTTTCNISSKYRTFQVSVNDERPATTREFKDDFTESKTLVHEYTFNKNSFSMKAYLISKTDKKVLGGNPETINFDRNDQKTISYRYNDEEAFDVSIRCATNAPVKVEVDLE